MVQNRVFLLPSVVIGGNQNHPVVMRRNGVLKMELIIRAGGGIGVEDGT
jgi:hypothetical protein